MSRIARQKFDVLVVGAGPAGMAAAARAGESGAHVGLVDDNFNPGGQIWRGGVEGSNPHAADWIERLQAAKVVKLCGMRSLSPAGNWSAAGRIGKRGLRTPI